MRALIETRKTYIYLGQGIRMTATASSTVSYVLSCCFHVHDSKSLASPRTKTVPAIYYAMV